MPTIKDVAERAMVSTATVSHVLNGTRVVHPDTRQRVSLAIEDLGYVKDGIARSLRVRASSTLALIVPDLGNPFFPELATAIQHEATRAGYDVVLYSVDIPGGNRHELFQHYLRAVRGKRYDAVILVEMLPMEPSARQQLVASGVPVVLIGGTPHPEADRVYIDDYQASRDVMDYLVARGHRLIAHISGAYGMSSARDRERGYCDGLRAASLPAEPALNVAGTFLREGGYTAMRRLLTVTPRPTAVFAANDLTALGAIVACLDAGLRVPDDMAVVGFDDITLAADLRPSLTTVYHGQQELGQAAVRLAVARISGDAPPEKQTAIVPHRLVTRASA